MSMKVVIPGLAAILAFSSIHALAADQITTTVTAPGAVIVNNDATNGQVQLTYTVAGTQFCSSTGTQVFKTFNVGLAASAGSGNPVSTYPASLTLGQSGAGPVQLSASPSTFSVTSASWSDNATVTVSIDCSKVGTPSDGQLIEGILDESNLGNNHVGNASGIHVAIKLAYPTACLKAYSFETNQDTGILLNSIMVTANKSGSVKATNPGEISVDALVQNTCSASQSFDLAVGLDSDWHTNPSDNPGNATFTYNTTGEIDPSTFNLAAFGAGTAQGQQVCLSNVSLAGGDTFLTTVHSQIKSGLTALGLPSSFGFSATVYPANSGCSGTATASHASTLTYTVH